MDTVFLERFRKNKSFLFFKKYNFSQDSTLSGPLLNQYIKRENASGQLLEWNIVIRGVKGDSHDREIAQLGPYNVQLLERAKRSSSPPEVAHIGVLMTQGDIGIDLKQDLKELQKTKKANKDYANKSLESFLKDKREQEFPKLGLLIIYPIDKDSKPSGKHKVKLEAVEHIIGLGIVFPNSKGSYVHGQNYISVDSSLLEQDEYIFEEEEDEDG